MRKILLCIMLMSTLTNYAQTFTIEDKATIGVYEVSGKTKAQIFSAVTKWISTNYNSGKSVTQLSDADGGNIIVKGINEISYPSNSKIIYPHLNVPEKNIMKFNHLIEINIRDNKIRVIYRIVDIYYEASVLKYMTTEMIKMNFDCINLNGIPESTMLEYEKYMNTNLKKGMLGEEKRTNYITAMKQTLNDLNIDLIADMKTTMLSIQASVEKVDNW